MQDFYQDVPITTFRRELIDEDRVRVYITEQFDRFLQDHKSPYRVTHVYLCDYPKDIEVHAVDRQGNAPDEDSLGLSDLGFEEYRTLLQEVLKEILGCRYIGFPYCYFSK